MLLPIISVNFCGFEKINHLRLQVFCSTLKPTLVFCGYVRYSLVVTNRYVSTVFTQTTVRLIGPRDGPGVFTE